MANPQNDKNINHKSNVKELQQYLREIAYFNKQIPMIAIDGYYTQKVATAVATFQQYYQLPITGEVNEQTWNKIIEQHKVFTDSAVLPAAIDAFFPENDIIKFGDKGSTVYFLQVMLKELSEKYTNIGYLDINGIYDIRTANAVQVLQNTARLKETAQQQVDGVDKTTWNNIANIFNATIK